MYLKWVDNDMGKVWFFKPGLKNFIESRLYEGVFCRDVSFMGEKNQLFVSLVLSDDSTYMDKLRISEDITEKLASMGIDAVVSWKHSADEKGQEGPTLTERPYFWGVVGAALTAIFIMGLKDTLTCISMGALFYGISVFFLSDPGRRILVRWARFIKEMIN